MVTIAEAKQIAGRYEVLRPLGRGGLGDVHLVRDLYRDGALCVVKSLARGLFTSAWVRRLKRDFLTLRRLSHPRIARYFDFGFDDLSRSHFFTMEFVEGNPLLDVVLERPQDDVVPLAVEVLGALNYLHGRGRIHGPLRPGDIIVVSGGDGEHVKLVDVGLPDSGHDGQGAGAVDAGAPWYVAPEVRAGEPGDARSDLYSFGVVLHQALTGFLPSGVAGAPGDERADPDGKDPISWVGPLAAVLRKLLHPSPHERFQSAAAVAAALNASLGTSHTITDPTPPETCLVVPPLIGRDREMTRLQGLLPRTAAEPQLLTVEGERGVGKSRILAEFKTIAEMRGFRVVDCASSRGRAFPLKALQQVLRTVARTCFPPERLAEIHGPFLKVLAPELFAGFRDPGEEDLSADDAKIRLFDHAAAYLRGAVPRDGLIVLLDDLHWIDPLSAEFLGYFLRDRTPSKVRFVATLDRSELGSGTTAEAVRPILADPNSEALEISPLAQPEVEKLIASILGSSDPLRGLTGTIHELSSGNPLLIEELLRSLIEGDAEALISVSSPGQDEGKSSHAGARVRSIVTGRLSRLDYEARVLAQVLALVDRALSFEVVRKIAADVAVVTVEHLQALVDLGFVTRSDSPEGETVTLSSLLAREAAEDLFDAETIERLRRSAARVLIENGTDPLVVVEHVLEGRPDGMDPELLIIAAERALRLYHYGAATSIAAEARVRAAAAGDPALDRRAAMLIVKSAKESGDLEGAAKVLQGLLDQGEETLPAVERAGVLRERAHVARLQGRLTESERMLLAALDLLAADADDSLRASILSSLANTLLRSGRFEDGTRRCFEALEVLGGAGADRDVAQILSSLGLLSWYRGDLDDASRHLQRCLRLRKRAGDASGLAAARVNLGLVAWHRGSLRSALREFRRAERQAEKAGSFLTLVSARHNLAVVLLEMGRLEEAGRALRSTLQMRERIGDVAGACKAATNLGLLHYYAGSYTLARRFYEVVRGNRDAAGDLEGVSSTDVNEGYLRLRLGDLDGAAILACRSARAAARSGAHARLGEACLLLAELRTEQRSFVLAERAIAAARRIQARIGSKVDLAALDLAEARLDAARGSIAAARRRCASVLLESRRAGAAWFLCQGLLLALELGEPCRGSPTAERALALAQRAGFRDLEWQAELEVVRRRQDPGDARSFESLRRAMECLRSVAADMPEAERGRWLDEPKKKLVRRLFHDASLLRCREDAGGPAAREGAGGA